jgi:hypothetical protein
MAANYGTVTVNISADLSEFRKSLRRVLNAVEELDLAVKELNTAPIKMNVGEVDLAKGGVVSNEEIARLNGWTLRNGA